MREGAIVGGAQECHNIKHITTHSHKTNNINEVYTHSYNTPKRSDVVVFVA
jgi:hypothetical protein